MSQSDRNRMSLKSQRPETILPNLVNTNCSNGSGDSRWMYYEDFYVESDTDSDTRSTYSIASLTFQRDKRPLFPQISGQKNENTASPLLSKNPTGLPDLGHNTCVVMTSRRTRRKKKSHKPRKQSGRYLPEISNANSEGAPEPRMARARSFSSGDAEEVMIEVPVKTDNKKSSSKTPKAKKCVCGNDNSGNSKSTFKLPEI